MKKASLLQRTKSSVRSATLIVLIYEQQEKQHYNKPALEWDIFLDPSLVRRVDMALHTVDTLEIQLRKIRMKRERLRQQKLKENDIQSFPSLVML